MMKDEKIIQYLKDANLWGENNLYFFAMAPNSFSNQKSIYGTKQMEIKFYIVNENENGIAIIPFDETLKSIKQLITIIPHENIKEVYTEKYKFMFFLKGNRLIIKTNENKVVELECPHPKKETEEFLNSNIYKFILKYKNNEHKENKNVIMKIDFTLKDRININNDLCCKIEITDNKKIKEDIKKLYSNKILEAMQSGKMKIYFYAETLPDDEKTIKITTEIFTEVLYDMGWYFKDNEIEANDIEDNNFEVIIVAEEQKTQDIYITACKKMGLI